MNFTMTDLQEFEELEIYGGGTGEAVSQNSCSNNVAGCAGCSVDEGCSNNVSGCACEDKDDKEDKDTSAENP